MNIKIFAVPLILFVFISCVGQNNAAFTPEPDFSVYSVPENFIEVNNIIETKDGSGVGSMPHWLIAYIDGGIEAVEKLEAYSSKYVFIAVNEGENFSVLNKWIENFSERLDFPMFAAARIDKRMIASASLYPDNEYGRFYETMIKNAHSSVYPGAEKEGTYWIKVWFERENTWEYAENYKFFVLITMNKMSLQTIIRNMIIRVENAVTATSAQSSAISRLRQSFFEGF